jgi:hypothetical protein
MDSATFFPRLLAGTSKETLFDTREVSGTHTPNLSDPAKSFLGVLDPGARSEEITSALFDHIVAIMHSSEFRTENLSSLRRDWPRIPLPGSKELLLSSSELGHTISSLLDTKSEAIGISTGRVRPELKGLAEISRLGGGNLKESELALTAGWGHAGNGGVTMPGRGKTTERDYSAAELKRILEGIASPGLSDKKTLELLGSKTYDVYLNNVAYWSNIPEKVWDYTIGGYQVIKKWLSYREQPLLGRALTIDEVRYVQEMARRIAAILLLGPALDANYEAVKAHTFPWPPSS